MLNDEKNWFIAINDHHEGPYSLSQLKRDARLFPDTLVWREGFPDWTPARKVPELREIFNQDSDEPEESDDQKKISAEGNGEIAVGLLPDYTPMMWWLIMILLLSYATYRLFFDQ
jgi:hypothetical protein